MSNGTGIGTAGRMWARSELRRRFVALMALGILAGLAAAVALAAIAGSRRTDDSFERLRTATKAADAVVFASQVGVTDPDWAKVAALPYVEAAGAFGLPQVQVVDAPKGIDPTTTGVFDVAYGTWRTDVDRPVLLEGRQPDPTNPHEVLATPDSLDAGVRLGDRFEVRRISDEQMQNGDMFGTPQGPTTSVTVVGVGRSTFETATLASDSGPEAEPSVGLVATPAFHEQFAKDVTFIDNLLVRFKPGQGSVPELERDVRQILDKPELPILDAVAVSKRVTNGTELETRGLLLFGSAVALAGAVLIGQALTRSVRSGSEDVSTLQALGFTRRDAATTLTLPHLLAVGVAAVVAVAGAVALSAAFPIGLGRTVDPDVGIHADWPVLIGGSLLLVIVLATAVVVTAWREAGRTGQDAHGRESALTRTLARSGAPIVVTLGARLALEPGRGKRALPTRPALAGAVIGVLGIVGAFTLSAGINDAVANPERIGSTWDMDLLSNGGTPADYEAASAGVDERSQVESSAMIARGLAVIDQVTQPTYSIRQRRGDLDFVTLQGRRPVDTGEVALGPETATAYGVDVGDDVTARNQVSGGTTTLRVVGIGLLPTTPHSSFDQGAWVTDAQLKELVPDTITDQGFPTIEPIYVAHLRDGEDAAGFVKDVNATLDPSIVLAEVRAIPIDLVSLGNVRSLPVLFAIFTLLLAIGTLAHMSSSVVRRRGTELAVLRAIGLTARQTRFTLSWQAMTVALAGVLIGIPLGLLVGRVAWRWVADATPMLYVPPTALVVVLATIPAALVIANLLAWWPGRRASRLRPAEMLRTE